MQETEKEFSYDSFRKVYQDKTQQLESTIEDIKKQLQDAQEINSDLERELEQTENFLNKAKEIIKKVNSECEINTKELHNAKLEVDKYKSDAHSFEKKLLDIQRSLNEFEILVKTNDNLRKQVRDIKQKLQAKQSSFDEKIAQQNELIDNIYHEKEDLNKAIEELELKLGEIEKENDNRETIFLQEYSKAEDFKTQLKIKDQEIHSLKEYLKTQEEAFNIEMQQIKRATENTLRNYHAMHSISTDVLTPRESFSSPAKIRSSSNRTPMKKSASKLTPMKSPALFQEPKEEETHSLIDLNLKDLLNGAMLRESNLHNGIVNIVNQEGNFIKLRLDSLNKAHTYMKAETERWIMRNEEMESRLLQSAETNKSFYALNEEYKKVILIKTKQLKESKVIIDELMKYLSTKDVVHKDEVEYLDDLIINQVFPQSRTLLEDTTRSIYRIKDNYKDKTINFERYIENINNDKIYWQDTCKQYQAEILSLREQLDILRNDYTAVTEQLQSINQEFNELDRILDNRPYSHTRQKSIIGKVEDIQSDYQIQFRQMEELKQQYTNLINQLDQFRQQHTYQVDKLETEVLLLNKENAQLNIELQDSRAKSLHSQDHQIRISELEAKLVSFIDALSAKDNELIRLRRSLEEEADTYEHNLNKLLEDNRSFKNEQFESVVLRDQLAAQSQLIDSLHTKITRLTEELNCREVFKYSEEENARLNSELDEAVFQLTESRRRKSHTDDKTMDSLFGILNVFKKLLEGFTEQKISADNYLRSLKGRLSPEYEDILKRLYTQIITLSEENNFTKERELNFYKEILNILSVHISTPDKQKKANDLISALRNPNLSDNIYISTQLVRLLDHLINIEINPTPTHESDRVLQYNLGRLERANLLMKERHNSLTQVLKKTDDMINSLIDIGDNLIKPTVLHKIVDMYYKFFTYFIKDYENDQKRYLNIYESLKSRFDGNIEIQSSGRFHEEEIGRLKQGTAVHMLDLSNLLRPIV